MTGSLQIAFHVCRNADHVSDWIQIAPPVSEAIETMIPHPALVWVVFSMTLWMQIVKPADIVVAPAKALHFNVIVVKVNIEGWILHRALVKTGISMMELIQIAKNAMKDVSLAKTHLLTV